MNTEDLFKPERIIDFGKNIFNPYLIIGLIFLSILVLVGFLIFKQINFYYFQKNKKVEVYEELRLYKGKKEVDYYYDLLSEWFPRLRSE